MESLCFRYRYLGMLGDVVSETVHSFSSRCPLPSLCPPELLGSELVLFAMDPEDAQLAFYPPPHRFIFQHVRNTNFRACEIFILSSLHPSQSLCCKAVFL